MRKGMIALVSLALLIGAAGCGVDKSREDSDDVQGRCSYTKEGTPSTTQPCVDKTAARVLAFHNKFSNVATKCDGFGHRIFVTTSKVFVVYPDPTCPGYVDGKTNSVIVNPPAAIPSGG